MNLLLDPNLWEHEGTSPPISWNPGTERYEILVQSSAGSGDRWPLNLTVTASAGDTISFSYDVSAYVNDNDHPTTLHVWKWGVDDNGSVWALPLTGLPLSGNVSIDCEEGAAYEFVLDRDGGGQLVIYDFEAIITPTPEPDPELIANDDAAETEAGVPVQIDILANDTLDGQPVQLGDIAGLPVVVDGPHNGSAEVNEDGTITYSPDPGFSGVDEFVYEISPHESGGWVPLHKSPFAPEFGSSGDAIFENDTISHGENVWWWLAFHRDDLPERVRFFNESWEADAPGPEYIAPFSYGVDTGPGFISSELIIDSQSNEAGDFNSEWLPSPMEYDGFETSGEAPYVIFQYRFLGEQTGGEAAWRVEVWSDSVGSSQATVTINVVSPCSYNCECDDEYPTRTLEQMREFLMIRLGWAAMKDTPLPGVVDTLNAFLQDAQEQLHAEYRLPRLERFFTWDLVEGVRFYDLPENRDECTKELDPRQLTWVGISDGCDAWRQLVCGIPPESYYSDVTGIPSRYEIRQCIEVWPPPSGDNWKLRVKGYFYNERLEEDEDVASLDYQAVQLFALANAKAHYGQQDAANVMRQAMRYVGNMTAGAHHTRRYVPGTTEWVAPPLPVLTGYPGDP